MPHEVVVKFGGCFGVIWFNATNIAGNLDSNTWNRKILPAFRCVFSWLFIAVVIAVSLFCFVCRSVRQATTRSLYLSTYTSFAHLLINVCLFIRSSISLSIYLSTYLYIDQSIRKAHLVICLLYLQHLSQKKLDHFLHGSYKGFSGCSGAFSSPKPRALIAFRKACWQNRVLAQEHHLQRSSIFRQ